MRKQKGYTMLTLTKIMKAIGAILAMLLLGFSTYMSYQYMVNDHARQPKYVVYEEMTTLKYENAKYNLVTSVDSYIKRVAPLSCLDGIVVVNKCIEYDVDICFVLAQGQVESAFGTTGLARKTNGVWNVYAYDGLTYDTMSPKGKYASPNEAVEPYLRLITSRYIANGKTEYDMLDKYVDVNNKRYASDKSYEQKLMRLYNTIKTSTPIDSLSLEMKKYAIILGY